MVEPSQLREISRSFPHGCARTALRRALRLALVVLLMAFVAGRAAGLAPMKPRIELFFKTPSELRTRLRELTAAGFDSFNLVNKDKKDPMLSWVDVCCAELGPGYDVCAHFSSKYNAKG